MYFRSLSDRIPRPVAALENVCPYSSINLQMESDLGDDHHSSRPDRYTKLATYEQHASGHSHSMLELPTSSCNSPTTNHKEWMSEIKRDLEQFSQEHGKMGAEQPDKSTDEQRIPTVSSRWSQFMCEEDESGSDEEIGVSSQHDCTTHILSSKSMIAKFNFTS